MTRKDLRSGERDWRATNQPTNRPLPAPKKSGIKLLTILWVIAVAICLLVLWETQKSCERINGSNSSACVD